MQVRIIIATQSYEKERRWKAAGGSDYVIGYISYEEAAKGSDYLYTTYVEPNLNVINVAPSGDDEYDYEEYMIDWFLLFDGELTHAEALEMEYEGHIDYPAKPLGAAAYAGPWLPIDAMKGFAEYMEKQKKVT